MDFKFDLARFINFRDQEALDRVRAIKKEDYTKHPNPDFKIKIIESKDQFYIEFALDLVTRIRTALEEGRDFVGILPVGPVPQYEIAARIINEFQIP